MCGKRWGLLFSAFFTAQLFAGSCPEFLMTTCSKCHGPEKQKGDHRFDSLTAAITTADDALLWQEILDQLNQGEMPPHKEKQPPKPELLPAVDAITASVGEAAQRFKATAPHSVLRRLNSYEYRQTIGDLLGLNVAGWIPTVDFPPESRVGGFDNNAAAQVTSKMLLDRAAADRFGLARPVQSATLPDPGLTPSAWPKTPKPQPVFSSRRRTAGGVVRSAGVSARQKPIASPRHARGGARIFEDLLSLLHPESLRTQNPKT